MSNADKFDPNAALTGDNFTYFRAFIARQNNIGQGIFGNFDGTVEAYSNLDADEQIALTNAQNAYIRANPSIANTIQQKLASAAPIEKLEEKTIAEKVTEVPGVGTVIDTAYEVNNDLNPFAFLDSLSKIKWFIILGVVGYFVVLPIVKANIAKK